MTSTASRTRRTISGVRLESGVLAIASNWTKLPAELASHTTSPDVLIFDVPLEACECDVLAESCSCPATVVDVVTIHDPVDDHRSDGTVFGDRASDGHSLGDIVAVEIAFHTPELLERARTALALSGISEENPSYRDALQGMHRAMRAELHQWAPETPGTTHGTLHADGELLIGDAYFQPATSVAISGTLTATWWWDEHGALTRLVLAR